MKIWGEGGRGERRSRGRENEDWGGGVRDGV